MMNILAKFRLPQPGTHRRRAAVACGILAALSVCGVASAQFGPSIELPPGLPTVMPAPPGGYPSTVATTAAVPYYAPPAWSQTLAPNVRFVILSNFNNDAVLDRETGLVWSRKSAVDIVGFPITAEFADAACERLATGKRMGWRLPTVAELQSLVDPSLPTSESEPRLPPGHPFLLSPPGFHGHWTSQTSISDDVTWRRFVDLNHGFTTAVPASSSAALAVLCVRGSDAGK